MEQQAEIRLLWVEDDPDDYMLARSALKAARGAAFDLTWVTTYEAALEAIARSPFDICLVDYRLGAHTGLDLVQAGAELGLGMPMVLLTSLEDETVAMRAAEQGAQDYLVKGQVSGSILLRVIRYAIERARMQAALRDLSLQDDLTGLHNRRGFFSLASQYLKVAQRHGQLCGVLYADLDRLKWINDTFGHQTGSQAIVEAAGVLRTTFRASDILARLGGDEFVVLVTDTDDVGGAVLAQRLEHALGEHNRQAGRSFDLSISVGFVQIDLSSAHALEDAIAGADQAMYAHKRAKHAARTADAIIDGA